jgi:hypothetical protein
MTSQSQFERSLAAIETRFPQAYAQAREPQVHMSPIVEDGAIVDLDVSGRRLYDQDGRRHAEEQLNKYFHKPSRFNIEDPRGAGMGSPVGQRMLARMAVEINRLGITELDKMPETGNYFLIVLGVGLGYHLPRLIAESKAKFVLIVEPLPELLHWSLHALDWQTLLDESEARGVEIILHCGDDPGRITDWIMAAIKQRGLGLFDGSYVFSHYSIWALRDAHDRLVDQANRRFTACGFYEDEIIMSTNAVGNMLTHRGYFVDGVARMERSEPVFIIGSGPSVDEAIATIQRWRDKAIVISCGTGLRVLLRNGITPDFHVEIENGAWVAEVLGHAAALGDLSKISLITTFTVDPSVPPMFRETFFFFRDLISSTLMLSGGNRPVSNATPTVANTAVSMASILGFKEFYLFGVDCGVRAGADNHSRHSIYQDVAKWKEQDKSIKFPTATPANFGGTAYTDWLLEWSRVMLAAVIGSRDLTVYNCSDGTLIANTIPKVIEAVDLSDRRCDHDQVLANFRRSLKTIAPGDMVRDLDFRDLAEEVRTLREDIDSAVDEAVAEGGGFSELYTAMDGFLAKNYGGYSGVLSIPAGSIASVPRIGLFYGLRIKDEEARGELFTAFVEEYKTLCGEMCEETAAMLEGFADRMEALPTREIAAAG